jgi:hypothetical protein
MTTYSKDTRWGPKHRTDLHLIYRIRKGRLEALGLCETRKVAERELAAVNRDGSWRIADVTCLAWGIVDDRVERNKPIGPLSSEELIELARMPLTEDELPIWP